MVRVSTSQLLAIPVGLALGIGLWTLLALVPRVGASPLATRVAPYLIDVSSAAREVADRRPTEPAMLVVGLVAPAAARIRNIVASVLGGDDGVERRLRQTGSLVTVESFRSRQLLSTAAGIVVGIAVAAGAVRISPPSPLVVAGIVVLCAAAGLLAPEQLLARQARARQARIAAELPTVLEFLALSLSAGEGVRDALRRVAATGNGELARELGRVVAEVNAGTPLSDALGRCASAIGLPALTRTVDQLVAALDRGTPLVEVFRAQAQDARDDTKRQLLESAGKKEIAMLVPLVFGVLPVTIAFAVFPATLVLQLGF